MAKLHNEYAALLGPLYAKFPKAVLAAIAVSFATRLSGNDAIHKAKEDMLCEWEVLYQQKIVPQKPPKA